MSWIDDLSSAVKNAQNTASNIGDFFKQVSGSDTPNVVVAAPPVSAGAQIQAMAPNLAQYALPVLAIAITAALLLKRK